MLAGSLSIVPPAQAQTCQGAFTLWEGTPWARAFPEVCGEEARMALWNNELGPYMEANSAAVAAWSEQRAAELAAEQAAREAAEAARLAQEQAEQEAAAAAADAANCVDAMSVYSGTQWERTFPAVCTAAGIQARAEEIRIYSENVAMFQASQNPTDQPNPENFDCNLEVWRNSAFCLNQGGQNNQAQIPVVNPDGSLNCANIVNANTAQCTGTVPTSQDCSLPQNLALPFCVNSQPMYNQDGSLNCAAPANATMAACLNLFKASETGQINCALPELQNMPICKQGNVATNGAPASNVTTAPALPTVTGPGMPAATLPRSGESNQQENTQNKVVVSEKATKDKEENFAESDGEEEEPSASLSVSFNASQNRYVIRVDSNLAGERLTIRATKKGAKSLRYSLSIDEDGVGGVRTKTKLAGFTLTLFYGSVKLDQVRVR